MYVWMCALQVPQQSNEFYLYFSIQEFMQSRQCPVNLNIPVPKTGAIQMNCKTQNCDLKNYLMAKFLKNSIIGQVNSTVVWNLVPKWSTEQ
jgi:hypothetical protein